MLTMFVIPSRGTSTTAARTAFLTRKSQFSIDSGRYFFFDFSTHFTCSTSLVWLCRSFTTNTLIMLSKNKKFNYKKEKSQF